MRIKEIYSEAVRKAGKNILQGVMRAKMEGDWVYDGETSKNSITGRGMLSRVDKHFSGGTIPFYRGEFKDGNFEGFGKLWLKDKKIFMGEFHKGKESNIGSVADWKHMIGGTFKEGQMDGTMIKFFKKKLIEVCKMEKGLKEGECLKIVDDKEGLLELYEQGELKMVI